MPLSLITISLVSTLPYSRSRTYLSYNATGGGGGRVGESLITVLYETITRFKNGLGVIGGNIDHIAGIGSALADGGQIVGVRECVILAGVAKFFQAGLYGINLILAVCFGAAIQQTNGLCIGEQFLDDSCLLIQRSEIGSTGNISANGSCPVINFQCGSIVSNTGSYNRNISRCCSCCLKSTCRICEDQNFKITV